MLDTAPEPALDAIVALAARICDAPIALISLVDDQRQWFKSRIGFGPQETPRDVSFCGHAILQPGLFVVPDATRDERFAHNPLVVEAPHIRSYAGAPLITPDGDAIGTLCVMDTKPHELAPDQRDTLQMLSVQVMAQLELRRRTRELVESESQLRAIFSACPVALAVRRWSDDTFVDANAAFTEIVGWQRSELIGRTPVEMGIVPAETTQALRARLTAMPRAHAVEVEIRTRDGQPRTMLMGAELVDLRHEPHFVITLLDITDQKNRPEVSSSRLGAIVESSDDAIIGKNLDGIITSWNAGAERIFGYEAAEILGTSILRIIPADRHEEERRILDRVRRVSESITSRRSGSPGTAGSSTLTVSRKFPIKGRDRPCRRRRSKVASGDVTAQRRAEDERQTSDTRYRTLFDYAPDGHRHRGRRQHLPRREREHVPHARVQRLGTNSLASTRPTSCRRRRCRRSIPPSPRSRRKPTTGVSGSSAAKTARPSRPT